MKGLLILLIFFVLFYISNISCVQAQKITYSPEQPFSSNISSFEILGKVSNYIVVAQIFNKAVELDYYDAASMNFIKKISLPFIDGKFDDIYFIPYQNKINVIWTLQKSTADVCKAAILDSAGAIAMKPVVLDSIKHGFFDGRTKFGVSWSEDEQLILISANKFEEKEFSYKLLYFNDDFQIFNIKNRSEVYNKNRDVYSDFYITNDTTAAYFVELENNSENTRKYHINCLKNNSDSIITYLVDPQTVTLSSTTLYIDNINRNILLTSFLLDKNNNTRGLYHARVSTVNTNSLFTASYLFPDSIRNKFTASKLGNRLYNNFEFKNIVFTKGGNFVVLMEDFWQERQASRFPMNNGMFGGWNPYYTYSDYYWFNRGFGGFYRPFGGYYNNSNAAVIYNYGDIFIAGVSGTALQPNWYNVINKKTSEVNTDNYLSFETVIGQQELGFLFLQQMSTKSILSNFSLQTSGAIVRNPTIRSGNEHISFMPRLGKQIAINKLVLPCLYRNKLVIARIDF